MNCEPISPDLWRLSFTEPEAEFLINVLARLGKSYQEDVARMSPALRAYWEGSICRGDVADKDDMKESQEVLAESRAELRVERLALVENWMRDFELAEARDPWKVEISGAERDEFISMLNDRRMLLALEMGVTEEDMEAAPHEIPNETRRVSILEIDVLGHFILIMLGPQIYRP
jgi:hypothetical protein